ncbi:MAG TPA: MGMT family protein [bacterium]
MKPRARRAPTTFESKVYAAARRIPRGRTRSYGWVARRAGKPGAARAAGNALNRNPFAPRVPCHRVVRSDGRLGGFARGPAAKRRLLEREGVVIRNGKVAGSRNDQGSSRSRNAQRETRNVG